MKTFMDILKKLNACSDARKWAGDMNIEEVVEKCHRGDWLLWLAKRIEIDHRKLTLAKGYCANTVRHLMKDQRSIDAVDAAIAYGEGKISDEELSSAAYAAYAADAAAYAAADAAYAAAYAAADAADAAAKQKNQLQTSDICRQYIGQEIIDKVNKMLK